MGNAFNYIGVKYKQGANKQDLLTFCATAADIHAWGGIPTKTERFHGGFQRALSDRYSKIVKFFEDGQTSPTSIVVAFREGALKVTDLGYPPAWVDQGKLSQTPSFAHIAFELEDFDADTADLKTLSATVCDMLRPRIERSDATLGASSGAETEETGEVEGDAITGEDSEDSLAETTVALSETEDEGDEASLEIDVGQSKLRSFYDFLSDQTKVDAWLASETARYDKIKANKPKGRAEKEYVAITPEQRLKQSLISLLRPAMIVDGQHRVAGAYQASTPAITFTVCAIKDADWVEQVFQFVVLNKLAKPISSSFLTALLNTSLTNEELTDIEPRLETVGINNTDRLLMKYINHVEKSPFYDMVSQPGDMAGADNMGKLSDKGMLRIAKRWHNLASGGRKELSMFMPAMAESHLGKARSKWRKCWSEYFYAFWGVLRAKYEKEGLWDKRGGNNLMYIVTLMTLQDQFLTKKSEGDSQFRDMDDFKEQVERFFERVPGTFFLGWEATGLQSGQGPTHIALAIKQLREGRQLGTVKDTSELFRKL